MLKVSFPDDDNVRVYYSYVKTLMVASHYLTSSKPIEEQIRKLLLEIDEYHKKLDDNNLQNIGQRLCFFALESVYTRQKEFYDLILSKYFPQVYDKTGDHFVSNFPLDMDNGHSEREVDNFTVAELQDIVNSDINLRTTWSSVFTHKSIYNSFDTSAVYVNKFSIGANRIYFYEHFFLWFEDYLSKYRRTMYTLLEEDGYIPKTWRYYIAIMAVGALKSEYMLRVLEEHFLDAGGDESWLIYGLDVVPIKLKMLGKVNNFIAHQPWGLLRDDILELTQKTDQCQSNSWNLNEFIHAALIMIQFHKLAGIAQSLGLKLCNNEKEFAHEMTKSKSFHLKSDMINTIQKNLDIIIKSEEETANDESSGRKVICPNRRQESFSSVDSLEKSESENDYFNSSEANFPIFEKHIYKYCLSYHDFDSHSESYRSFLEFNWNDHGYYILHSLFPKGVDSMKEEFEYIDSLTTNSLGLGISQLNTTPIRTAITYYIERIFGYKHEDYNYANVNKLLLVNFKKFIKNVACYPDRLKRNDFQMMSLNFKYEEVMHIILLVTIMKNRAQLTYLAKHIYDIIKTIE